MVELRLEDRKIYIRESIGDVRNDLKVRGLRARLGRLVAVDISKNGQP